VGRRHRVGGRTLCVGQQRGTHIVTHTDGNGLGYIFISEMDARTLVDFVSTSDLLLRAPGTRRSPMH
jgi:hypothetical protein